jgi:hypothetical protein
LFPYLFCLFLVLMVAADYIFLPSVARRAWQVMALALAAVATMLVFPGAWQRLAELVGIGRAVDILIYGASTILLREMFIARGRFRASERNLTLLVRSLAIRDAKRL